MVRPIPAGETPAATAVAFEVTAFNSPIALHLADVFLWSGAAHRHDQFSINSAAILPQKNAKIAENWISAPMPKIPNALGRQVKRPSTITLLNPSIYVFFAFLRG